MGIDESTQEKAWYYLVRGLNRVVLAAKLNLMSDSKDNLPEVPYAQLVCALLFMAKCTRPDSAIFVTLLCRCLTNCAAPHFKAAMRVYLKCAKALKLRNMLAPKVKSLEICIDSDERADNETDRYTIEGITCLYGDQVTWLCRRQGGFAVHM